MKKLRLVAVVLLLAASLSGAFSAPVQATPWDFPWCYEDYQACLQSGADFSDCYCYYQMCIGRLCP